MSGIHLDEVILDATTSSIAISDGTNTASVDANGGLDVNILGGVNVEVDLSHLDDSVRLGDGTSFFTSTSENGDIALDVHISNTSLDVNLSSTVADDDPWTENGVPMAARGVDGLLTALSADGDKYDLTGDLYRRTHVNTSNNIGVKNTVDTIGVAAAQVLATPLAGRKEVIIQNDSNNDVYVGSSVGMTTANGLIINKHNSATIEVGDGVDLYMIADSAGSSVRFFELG